MIVSGLERQNIIVGSLVPVLTYPSVLTFYLKDKSCRNYYLAGILTPPNTLLMIDKGKSVVVLPYFYGLGSLRSKHRSSSNPIR